MAWTTQELEMLSQSEEIRITSFKRDGSQRNWTPIWIVRLGDALFVRSGGGVNGGWYRHATDQRGARIRGGGVDAEVNLRRVVDDQVNEDVNASYRSKYGNQPEFLLRLLITSPATESTVEVIKTGSIS